MGSLGSRLHSPSQRPEELVEATSSSHKHSCECKKRKRNAQCDCESEQDDESVLDTPRRKKLKSTSRYIYQTLFLNGENSDIRICALGQEWNLHKVYLCQVKTHVTFTNIRFLLSNTWLSSVLWRHI